MPPICFMVMPYSTKAIGASSKEWSAREDQAQSLLGGSASSRRPDCGLPDRYYLGVRRQTACKTYDLTLYRRQREWLNTERQSEADRTCAAKGMRP